MNKLCNIIGLDCDLISNLEKFTEKHSEKITNNSIRCANDFSILSTKNDLMRLAVCIEYAYTYTRAEYENRGISDDIFKATMQDIAVWCENNNNKGLRNYKWIENHLNCELFRIGRLQYQLYKCKNKTFDYDFLPFDYGDNLIYIHIPQGEKLIYSDCVDSIYKAKNFFKKYFPEFEYEFFFSESWLLYDENYAFMDVSSNILQFQSMFNIVFSDTDDRQAIDRIFGRRRLIKSNYPENTTLQRNAKKYMLNGGKLGIGIGVIDKNEI
ncbi:MAG: acyltransferase domain-containing protein [Eubacterium sp.]